MAEKENIEELKKTNKELREQISALSSLVAVQDLKISIFQSIRRVKKRRIGFLRHSLKEAKWKWLCPISCGVTTTVVLKTNSLCSGW